MALTDKQIADIIFNETRSLSGPSIQDARVNIAHVLLNGDTRLGNRRPMTAPATAKVPDAEKTIYAQCVLAVTIMRGHAEDSTEGATNFNFRPSTSRSDFFGLPIKTQIGPLNNSYPTPELPASGIYANTYGKP